MKKVIYKYALKTEAFSIVDGILRYHLAMPRDATFLCVRTVRGVPVIYALVDPDAPAIEYAFEVYATGQTFEVTCSCSQPTASPNDDPHTSSHDYVGTFQLDGGALIFHVFRCTDAGRADLNESTDRVFCRL